MTSVVDRPCRHLALGGREVNWFLVTSNCLQYTSSSLGTVWILSECQHETLLADVTLLSNSKL